MQQITAHYFPSFKETWSIINLHIWLVESCHSAKQTEEDSKTTTLHGRVLDTAGVTNIAGERVQVQAVEMMWMLRLSGPSAVEVPDSFMASRTSCGVKGLKLWSRGLFRIDLCSCLWLRSRGGARPV